VFVAWKERRRVRAEAAEAEAERRPPARPGEAEGEL
jgi:hypothetical protein